MNWLLAAVVDRDDNTMTPVGPTDAYECIFSIPVEKVRIKINEPNDSQLVGWLDYACLGIAHFAEIYFHTGGSANGWTTGWHLEAQ